MALFQKAFNFFAIKYIIPIVYATGEISIVNIKCKQIRSTIYISMVSPSTIEGHHDCSKPFGEAYRNGSTNKPGQSSCPALWFFSFSVLFTHWESYAKKKTESKTAVINTRRCELDFRCWCNSLRCFWTFHNYFFFGSFVIWCYVNWKFTYFYLGIFMIISDLLFLIGLYWGR